MSRILTLIIKKEKVEVDIDEELRIFDVGEEQAKVAFQMAYWGEIWASAKDEAIQVDSLYRKWRAKAGVDILEADPKLSEWKVKQLIEADPKFAVLKKTIAAAERNVTTANAIFVAFKSKAAVLSSKGAMDRAIFERTGMTTKTTTPKKKSVETTDEDKKKRMKQIFKKKNK
jgi:hypothetical protein